MKIRRILIRLAGPALVGVATHMVAAEAIEASKPACWIQWGICNAILDSPVHALDTGTLYATVVGPAL